MKNITKDDGVTSVVGEMLVIVLVLILISIFTMSAFSLLPGERDTVTVTAMNMTTDTITFWHKGGDWVDGTKLTASLTPSEGGEKIILSKILLNDCHDSESEIFDLGGYYSVNISGIDTGIYSLRLLAENNVIYAEDGLVIS